MKPKEENKSPVPQHDPNTLYIDVNIGEGRKARIVMTSSDNPAQLALNFAKVHNLDLSTQNELEAQLHLQKLTMFSGQ